jgi:hypothetical protein
MSRPKLSPEAEELVRKEGVRVLDACAKIADTLIDAASGSDGVELTPAIRDLACVVEAMVSIMAGGPPPDEP